METRETPEILTLLQEYARHLQAVRVKPLNEATLGKVHRVTTGANLQGEEAFAFFPTRGWVGAPSSINSKKGENLLAVIKREKIAPLVVAVIRYGLPSHDYQNYGVEVTIYA